jgi:hypothetical protein
MCTILIRDQIPSLFSSNMVSIAAICGTKIQKSARDYAHVALHKIDLLSGAAKGDPANSKCVVQLLDHFKHAVPNSQHVCLVTEFLGTACCCSTNSPNNNADECPEFHLRNAAGLLANRQRCLPKQIVDSKNK